MRVLFLADINSAHTIKWATALSKRGLTIAIFSITQATNDWYKEYDIVLLNSFSSSKNDLQGSSLSKVSYIKLVPKLKESIFQFKPDLIHAHYATSYGL